MKFVNGQKKNFHIKMDIKLSFIERMVEKNCSWNENW